MNCLAQDSECSRTYPDIAGLEHLALDDIPVPGFTCRLDGTIEASNGAVLRVWGRKPERSEPSWQFCSACGLRTSDGVPVGPENCPVTEALASHSVVVREYQLERSDGQASPLLGYATPLFSAERKVRGATLFFLQGVRLDNPRPAPAHLASLVHVREEKKELATCTLDRRGRIVTWPASCERMTGFQRECAVGEYYWFLSPTASAPGSPLRTALDRALTTGFAEEESVMVRADSSFFHGSTVVSPMAAPDGGHVGYSLTIKDLSEHKRLEDQILHAQRMETLGRIVGGIAHDFNNLLTVVSGYSELLAQSLPADGLERDSADQILQATRQATALTRQLLSFSRRQDAELGQVHLNDIVEGTTRILRRVIGESITLQSNLSECLPAVRADRSQLEQVVLNLVINACDAMPDGGTLTVETEEVTRDAIACAPFPGARPGRHVRLSVGDSGCGMTEQVRQRIFEPFFTTKDKDRGTGLGLATVLGIVQRHSGHIELESAPNAGTRFEIYLPIGAERSRSLPSEPVAEGPSGDETVLLVDNDHAERIRMKSQLEKHGYAVLDVANAVEAMRVVETCGDAIGITVTDLVLPDLSGVELADSVQKRVPSCPVVFLHSQPADSLGVQSGLLRKPVPAGDILRAVRTALDTAQCPSKADNRP